MRFSKSTIFFLNWDSYTKRIALLFIIIELSKQNDFLILSERESLEDQL